MYEGGRVVKQLCWYKQEIASDTKFILPIVEEIICFLKEYIVFSEELFFDVKVILNELMINAVIHGNKKNIEKKVLIKVGICDSNNLCIIIEDEGEELNKNICRCDDLANCFDEDSIMDLKECGRGLKIVKDLSDKVTFNKKGNRIVVLKNI